MPIGKDEIMIRGSIVDVDGEMMVDANLVRIQCLVRDELKFVATAPSGWETLYIDPRDGRYWEEFFPYGEMQGGGPESLRVLDPEQAQEKYRVNVNGRMPHP